MENKKITKIIALIIAILAIILIVTAVVLSLSGDKDTEKTNEYKQCAKKEGNENKTNNYEHNGLNYYIDKDNNRVNNSEELSKKHDSQGDTEKIGIMSITDMTIVSNNCDENAAEMNATLVNNSEENFTNFMLVFDIKDKDGNQKHVFSMDVKTLNAGESISINFKTLGRIIDAYDYEFTYVSSNEMVG